MTVLKDPERLSYTNKDVDSVDADITRYIKAFIPTIKGTSVSNEGRMVLRILAALTDMQNYSVDMQFREGNIEKVTQLKNAINITKLINYYKAGPSPSTADCTFSMLSGVAGAGGTAIALLTRVQKSSAPSRDFVTTEAATILEGDVSVIGVPVIQGLAVTGEVLTAAASGDPAQSYELAGDGVVVDQVVIDVGGVQWTKVDELYDSGPADLHYIVRFDEDNVCTVHFGDGEFGSIPTVGVGITCDYVNTNAEGNDAGEGEIDTIIGALSATVGVTNPLATAGASDGDTTDTIKVNAPAVLRTIWKGVTAPDLAELALRVAGVYSSKIALPYGNSIIVYVLPTGGGTASATLLTTVEEYLTERSVEMGVITAASASSARVRIECHVVAEDNRLSKSVLRGWVRSQLIAAFVYDQFDLGLGYTISEVGEIILSYQDSVPFRSVDFSILSRWPTTVQSNPAAPAINGDIQITSTAGYDTWVLTAVTTTTCQVAKNGVLNALCTAGVEYTSDDNEVTFTLGSTVDTFTIGDVWTFKTSKLAGNLFVDEYEHMSLAESDLAIHVYYPGEYDATT